MAQWQDELITRLDAPLAVVEVDPNAAAPIFAPTNATVTAVTLTNVATTVLPANPLRRRLILHNDSGSIVYIKFGTGATTSDFSFRIPANDTFLGVLGDYTGGVTGIRASGTSTLLVTEIYT